jgi:hypothetical protein
MEKLDPSEAVPILLIAGCDVRRYGELRHFLFNTGFLVASASNDLECPVEVVALEADALMIALEAPWGSCDGVISRLNDGLPSGRKPLILVTGDSPADTLSARTGVAPCNCFSTPLRKEGSAGPHSHRTWYQAAVRCRRKAMAIEETYDTNIDGERRPMIALTVRRDVLTSRSRVGR